jgi:hypothetical protein
MGDAWSQGLMPGTLATWEAEDGSSRSAGHIVYKTSSPKQLQQNGLEVCLKSYRTFFVSTKP